MIGQKILVVGTGSESLFLRGEVLERTGAQMIRAEGVGDLTAASLDHDLSLAVLDLSKPGTDGRGTAERLRSQQKTRSLPILFIAPVFLDDFHLFRGCDEGPVDFIAGDCHPKILLSKVSAFLELDRQRRDLLRQNELESSKHYLEAIFMSMSDPVIIVSPEGIVRDVNKSTLALLGFGDPGGLLGSPVHRYFEPSGNTVHLVSDFRLQVHSRMEDFQNIEILLRTADDGRIPALLSGSVFRDKLGRPMGMVLLVRDITERKRMEEQLNAAMLRLQQSNRQLQEFAAVASHDLQEPLRKIKAFGDLLLSKYGKELGDEAMDFLGRMRNAAERMGILMESLLTYSRVTTKAEPFGYVDLNQVVQNVLTDLEWRIKQTGAEVKVHHLGAIEAEPNQMHQLFQNLLGNALKFHGDQKPVVKVYCKPRLAHSRPKGGIDGRFCRICVEDNGIGFDEKYLDLLFAPFQRLHGRHEYEGTGMGLAICNRIVERHGGSIKASSRPGKGATFVVTLPIRQGEEPKDQPTTGSQLSLYHERREEEAGSKE